MMSDKQIKMADVFELPVPAYLFALSFGADKKKTRAVSFAVNNHDRLTAQIEAFKAFTDAMLDISWQGGDADGATIQELALKHGLLKEVTETGPCSDERCICAEVADFPITCNRKTYLDKEVESHAS